MHLILTAAVSGAVWDRHCVRKLCMFYRDNMHTSLRLMCHSGRILD